MVPDIVALLDGRSPAAPPQWTPLGAAELAQVLGSWEVPGVGNIAIEPRDGGLRVRSVTGVRYPLFRDAGPAFYAPGLEVWLGFDRDAAGRRSGLGARTLMGCARGTRAPGQPGEPPATGPRTSPRGLHGGRQTCERPDHGRGGKAAGGGRRLLAQPPFERVEVEFPFRDDARLEGARLDRSKGF